MSIDRKQLLQTLKKPFKSFNGPVLRYMRDNIYDYYLDQELIGWLTHFKGDVEKTILFLNTITQKRKMYEEDNIYEKWAFNRRMAQRKAKNLKELPERLAWNAAHPIPVITPDYEEIGDKDLKPISSSYDDAAVSSSLSLDDFNEDDGPKMNFPHDFREYGDRGAAEASSPQHSSSSLQLSDFSEPLNFSWDLDSTSSHNEAYIAPKIEESVASVKTRRRRRRSDLTHTAANIVASIGERLSRKGGKKTKKCKKSKNNLHIKS